MSLRIAQGTVSAIPQTNGEGVDNSKKKDPNIVVNNATCLKCKVVSAYDLPSREPPLGVRISVSSQSIKTGPPVQRHKDRNSFKFDSSSPLSLLSADPNNLEAWYNDDVWVEVIYHSQKSFKASYALKNLIIHEPTWLILTLEGGDTAEDNHSALASIGSDDGSLLHVRPTIRLQLTLIGPYRAEVSALLGFLGAWFGLVGKAETAICDASVCKLDIARVTRSLNTKWLLVPAVPLATVIIVSAPIVLGILTIGLPVFLPILVIVGMILCGIGCAILITWSSTSGGREQISGVTGPVWSAFLQSPLGQQLVYAIGPRPSPVALAQTITPTLMNQKLLWSLAIDAIGSSSYLIPFAGEGFDIAWAPLQTIFIMAMYDHIAPNLKYISAIEEILPFTDVIPSATMGWLTEFAMPIIAHVLNGGVKEGAASASASANGTTSTNSSDRY